MSRILYASWIISVVFWSVNSFALEYSISNHTDREFSAYPQKATVFDINIYAAAGVEPEKIQHAANVMAQYLDNDQDGILDQPNVHVVLKQRNSTLIIWKTASDLDSLTPPEGFHVQDLGADETVPAWHTDKTQRFDASLEEIFHLISASGYAHTYPNVFGEKPGTVMSNAMDKARGGRFTSVPTPYPASAWYTYDDTTCNYNCMASEYIYWALTSLLGAQASREGEISQEWRLNTADKLRQGDPDIYQLLVDPMFKLPSLLPDGNYRPEAVPKPSFDPTVLSGTWYDPSESGHGIMLQIFDSAEDNYGLTMTWFTYTDDRKQEWFYGDTKAIQSSRAGEAACFGEQGSYFGTMPTLRRRGGANVDRFKTSDVSSSYWGGISLCYQPSSNQLTLKYRKGSETKTQLLSKLTALSPKKGDGNGFEGMSGTWYQVSQPGQGLYLETIKRQSNVIGINLAWYGFESGSPLYLLGSLDSIPPSQNSLTIPVYSTSGAAFGSSFMPSDVSRTNWGEITITRESCRGLVVKFSSNATNTELSLKRLSSVSGVTC